ncbi:MAG: hypothetical protein AB1629_04435 [Candidatus Omnitrophota bacterium]
MKKLPPIKAIRHKCLECQGNRYSLIRNCDNKDCPLYPYRLGHRPKVSEGINNTVFLQKVASSKGSFFRYD